MKRFRTSCILLCSAAVQAANTSDSKPEPVLVRRTDLPVYTEEIKTEIKNVEENTMMMEAIQSFRIEACKAAQTIKSVKDRCNQFIDTGVAHSYSNYMNAAEYLQADKNLLPRIGGGALVGYIFGMRKRFFKRILYTSIGGTVAAIFYPKEADKYFESSLQMSKRYFVIGYHFLNAVTKDVTGFELPALPQKEQEPSKRNQTSESS